MTPEGERKMLEFLTKIERHLYLGVFWTRVVATLVRYDNCDSDVEL